MGFVALIFCPHSAVMFSIAETCYCSSLHDIALRIVLSANLKFQTDLSPIMQPARSRILDSKAPVTPGLRPGYDLPATEKWANRRTNVRLVAEVVRLVAEVAGDRKGQISHNKVVVMFKTRSHRAYDQVTTYLRSKNDRMMGQS